MSPDFHKFSCTIRVSDGFALTLGDRNALFFSMYCLLLVYAYDVCSVLIDCIY